MKRVVPGILMALGCLALLFYGSVELIRTVITGVAILGLYEYFRISQPELRGGMLILTLFCSLFPALFCFAGRPEMVLAGTVLSFLAIAVISLKATTRITNAFSYLITSCFGSFYISLSLAHLGLIADMVDGALWLIVLLALIAGSDTGAYYFGKRFGKKKLCPTISPKKTVAGGYGGVATGTMLALLVLLLLPIEVNLVRFFPFAILLIVVGIVGDLVESTMKRSYNIKDSGTILGGHGGLLDRIDSLLLSGPLLFYLLSWRVF